MVCECQAEEEVSGFGENVGNNANVNGVDGADEEARMCVAHAAARLSFCFYVPNKHVIHTQTRIHTRIHAYNT